MTVTMMCEQRCRDREPLVARSSKDSYYWFTASKLVSRTSFLQWCLHAYLSSILPHSFWGQKRPLGVYATHHHYALLITNPIQKVQGKRNVFSTKNANSLISQISIHLVHTIQSNSLFDLMVSVSYLHWNRTQRGSPAIASQKYVWLFTDLPACWNILVIKQWSSAFRLGKSLYYSLLCLMINKWHRCYLHRYLQDTIQFNMLMLWHVFLD